jgi:hypothetical protein
MRVMLTDRFCATATPPARTDHFDEQVAGLALRVTERGHRSWSYLFTSPRDGKRARVALGTYPATSLAGARGKALEARTLCRKTRHATRATPSPAELAP